ncbi:conserved exported hypothetical protein [Vibrio chagasii]|nr:conserved exported hypothetical protein [Vibrio chagasii]CAH6963354.1 conserved exported hypothetical protein [Vibrio chagasii]CAH7006308.1 conserved exported hypothetical protein [Vibrio chagasii]CAH7036436.1 conserved exported hypothetical protein [Vibrio chagasii]CAH7070805.1 conserved exported hypothetical protein [Vibrio chagasii]
MMMKWIVLGLFTWCSFSGATAQGFDELSGSKNNPASMTYYLEYYKKPNNQEYQYLLATVRAAADTVDFYTTRLDARDQRIDYCLPMKDAANRDTLYNWKTKELMDLINNQIEHDPRVKKYNRLAGSIGSYLVAALKEQYPCPVQKQL